MITFTITNKIEIPYRYPDIDNFVYDSLKIDNPKYLENQRMKRYFANKTTPKYLKFYKEIGQDDDVELYVPRGFLSNLIEYCNDNNIEYQIDNKTHFYDDIDFEFDGELRPYQKIATDIMLSHNEGVLCSPTGSGKTFMAIYMIYRRRQPVLVIVHTRELLYQWRDSIKKFLKLTEQQIGCVGDGNLIYDKDICIALAQTLRKYPEIVNEFGYVIVDEVHRISSQMFIDSIEKFSGRYITGLSATPYRNDGLDCAINFYAGKIRHKVPQQELIKEGHITGIKSIIRKTNFISQLNNPANEYSKLLKELSENEERNELIIEDVITEVKNGEICLVLTDRKNHCHELKKILLSKRKISCEILTGDVDTIPRKRIVERVNNGKIKVLIATGQLIGEGFDCKMLSCLFLVLPISYKGRLIQYLGRGMRPRKGKKYATVYDYFDKSVRCLYSGFKKRQIEYQKLEV